MRALAALRGRDFRLLWISSWFWYSTYFMEALSLAVLTLQLTGSPLWIGVIAFCRLAPMMVLGVWAGLLSDLMGRKRMLLWVQAINLSAITILVVALLTGVVNLWYLIAVALILGCGHTGDPSARRPLIRDLVPPEHFTNAMALERVSSMGGRLSGTILTGVLIAAVGIKGPFLTMLVIHVLSISLLAFVRQQPRSMKREGQNALQDLIEGFGYIRRSRVILGVMTGSLVINSLLFPYREFIPVFAQDVLDVGPALMGLLASAEGMGALAAALFLTSLGTVRFHGRVLLGGIMLLAVALALFALSPIYPLSFGLLMVAGVGVAGYSTMQFTIPLLTTSQEMRGRVAGALVMIIGGLPLGALVLGSTVSTLGAPVAVAINAGTALPLMLLIWWSFPELRRPIHSARDVQV